MEQNMLKKYTITVRGENGSTNSFTVEFSTFGEAVKQAETFAAVFKADIVGVKETVTREPKKGK